ncbi:MAG TPA: hypothetical protein VFG72_05040 [Marmoricola sp.]|nr:hypothetical protein [Marmoricola sp.]
MEIDGLPLHPLINDSAVALVPLSVLAGLAFALLPSWRWLSRWAALLLTVGGMVALLATWWTGRDLLETRFASATGVLADRLQTHQDRADLLLWIYIAFTVVVLLAFFVLPAPTHLDSGRMGFAGNTAGWASLVVPAAVVVVGLAALVAVVLTGHAGAQVAFGPQ